MEPMETSEKEAAETIASFIQDAAVYVIQHTPMDAGAAFITQLGRTLKILGRLLEDWEALAAPGRKERSQWLP